MLKLLQFNGQTVTPKDDSLWNELITEKCGAFIGVDVTSLGSNVIKVTDGRILVKGRQIIITEEDVNVQLSTDGTKKGRLLIHVDLSSETPATFQSQVADELPELVQDDDFNESNGIYEIELAQYDVDVLALSNFEETIEKIDGVMEILSTEEELMANTQSGRVADALVVKNINSSLTNSLSSNGLTAPIEFGYDAENDVYGYIKVGADTVTPFNRVFKQTCEFAKYGSSNQKVHTYLNEYFSEYELQGITADNIVLDLNHNNIIFGYWNSGLVRLNTTYDAETTLLIISYYEPGGNASQGFYGGALTCPVYIIPN